MDYTGRPTPTNPPVISYFDEFQGSNPYAFLSNFFHGDPLTWQGRTYATGEHLFAALKADNDHDHERIRLSPGPGGAKGLGRSIRIRGDWEKIKYDAMVLVLNLKFTLQRAEGHLLLATGDALLVEGTWWADRVWGVDLSADRRGAPPWERYGRNWLGRLLMARRAELRAEQAFGVAPSIGAVDDFAMPPSAMTLTAEDQGWLDSEDLVDLVRFVKSGVDTVCPHESWEVDTAGMPIRCADCAHSFTPTEAAERHECGWPAGPVKVGDRLSHVSCDHADTKNARARCRRRWLKENAS